MTSQLQTPNQESWLGLKLICVVVIGATNETPGT